MNGRTKFGNVARVRFGTVRWEDDVKKLATVTLLASSLFGVSSAHAETWLRGGGLTTTPYGHHHYCRKRPADCGAMSVASPERLTASTMSKMRSVNRSVNRAIAPKSDHEAYGKKEYWAFPANVGDCEEYALAKRAKLLRAGFRSSNLKLAMSRRPNGEAHAVLVVRTNVGDYVLDNLVDAVLPVSQARMRFLKMQAPDDAARWVRVAGIARQMPH